MLSFINVINGGVTGRPETMCPRTNVLGPLVPKLIDLMTQCPSIDTSLSFCIMQYVLVGAK